MFLWNCKNYEIYPYIAPWLVPEPGKSLVDMCVELKNRLKNNPDDTLCAIAIEDKVCHAILIAYIYKEITWLWQARTGERFVKYSLYSFDSLKHWSRAKGTKEIRMRPIEKLRRYFERRYGFRSLDNGEMVCNL